MTQINSKLSGIENFSLTEKVTKGLCAINNSRFYILGAIGSRAGMVLIPIAAIVDTLAHTAFFAIKAPLVLTVGLLYNTVARCFGEKHVIKGLEISSALVHVVRVVESVAFGAFLPFVGLFDPARADALTRNYHHYLSKVVTELREEKKELGDKYNELQTEFDDLEEKYSTILKQQKEPNETVKQAQEKIQDLNRKLEENKKIQEKLQKEIDTNQKFISDLKNQLNQDSKNAKKIEEILQEQNQEIKELEEKYNELQVEHNNLEREYDELQGKINEKDQTIDDLNNQLDKNWQGMKETHQQLREEKDSLLIQLNEQDILIQNLEQRIKELEKQLKPQVTLNNSNYSDSFNEDPIILDENYDYDLSIINSRKEFLDNSISTSKVDTTGDGQSFITSISNLAKDLSTSRQLFRSQSMNASNTNMNRNDSSLSISRSIQQSLVMNTFFDEILNKKLKSVSQSKEVELLPQHINEIAKLTGEMLGRFQSNIETILDELEFIEEDEELNNLDFTRSINLMFKPVDQKSNFVKKGKGEKLDYLIQYFNKMLEECKQKKSNDPKMTTDANRDNSAKASAENRRQEILKNLALGKENNYELEQFLKDHPSEKIQDILSSSESKGWSIDTFKKNYELVHQAVSNAQIQLSITNNRGDKDEVGTMVEDNVEYELSIEESIELLLPTVEAVIKKLNMEFYNSWYQQVHVKTQNSNASGSKNETVKGIIFDKSFTDLEQSDLQNSSYDPMTKAKEFMNDNTPVQQKDEKNVGKLDLGNFKNANTTVQQKDEKKVGRLDLNNFNKIENLFAPKN